MKTLTLHCDCGQSTTVQGVDVAAIIKAIDALDWCDLPDEGNDFNHGNLPAYCPTCWANMDETE